MGYVKIIDSNSSIFRTSLKSLEFSKMAWSGSKRQRIEIYACSLLLFVVVVVSSMRLLLLLQLLMSRLWEIMKKNISYPIADEDVTAALLAYVSLSSVGWLRSAITNLQRFRLLAITTLRDYDSRWKQFSALTRICSAYTESRRLHFRGACTELQRLHRACSAWNLTFLETGHSDWLKQKLSDFKMLATPFVAYSWIKLWNKLLHSFSL